MEFKNTLEFAKELDQNDPLKSFREKFYIPILNKKESIYFTGNSLGLQSKNVQESILDELEDWANFGVEGHENARNPWLHYHEIFPEMLTEIVGAKIEEIVVMNQLTVNLHLMMETFYRPTTSRYKIICEAKAFPSDQYAFASQVKMHGYDPANAIIEVQPREGKETIEHSDILEAIKTHGNEIALVLFSGVNYYTGQVFDMKEITTAAHKVGAYCGFDLAHAAGNIPLELHNWDVDFACWCTYKYLNSGPGSVGGVYINEKHSTNKSIPRLEGWWGTNKKTRFKMEKDFDPIPTAEGWQLSNAPVLNMAAHKAALEIFMEAGIHNIFEKGKKLSAYLIYILQDINKEKDFEIITPLKDNEHGCQMSVSINNNGRKVFEELKKNGIIADWREPNVIRVAPVPLYNKYEDIYNFGETLKTALSKN